MRHWIVLLAALFGLNATYPHAADRATTPVPSTDEMHEARRVRLEREASTTSADIYIIGDSIAEMWPGDAIRPFTVQNFGVGGENTANVLWRLDHYQFAAHAPRFVILSIGTNNLWLDPPDSIAAGIKKVVSRIREIFPTTRIVILAILPRGVDFQDHAENRLKVNAEVARWAVAKGVDVLNLDREMSCNFSLQPCSNYRDDRLHPSPEGFGLLSNHFLRKVSPASSTAGGQR